jgi:NAD(P)H dehydrogenase (quinone)
MKTVLVVYTSVKGHTAHAADAIATGVRQAGCTAELRTADEATADHLKHCDALILGTPIHMGSADWRMKRFIDSVCGPLWMKDSMVGRIGAVFATGGGYGNGGGGADLCMVSMFANLAQLGFIMVPLPRNSPGFKAGGTPWGPYCRSQTPDLQYNGVEQLPVEACVSHGFNVAELAKALDRSALQLASGKSLPHSGKDPVKKGQT